MVLFAGADPLKWVQELVVIACVILALALCYRYRARVTFLLTGDDKIHANTLDCIYYTFCKCGGMCTGEWTRCLTSCPCCPEFLYKRNLVKMFAGFVGMSTKTIEVKNIVVGDLPYDKALGDFYVALSVSTNPDMVTSLQEDKKPKIVHFPEILQLKVRDSVIEPRVVVTVKELNIAGSETLCDLVLSSSSIIDWASDDEPLKRFQMRTLNSDIERETPPWIAMEFSYPTENRRLDTMPNLWNQLKVRTYLPYGGTGGAMAGASPSAQLGAHGASPFARGNSPGQVKKESIMEVDGTIRGTRSVMDEKIANFKHRYVLLDDSGNPVEEPNEDNLWRIQKMRSFVMYFFHLCDCCTFLLVIGYALFRFYIWSCYRQFNWLTQAQLNGQAFPISNDDLHDLVESCHNAVDGTGAELGTPCRPSADQILSFCETIQENNRPEAFVSLMHDWFGWNIKGIPCFHGCCELRSKLAEWDYTIGIACVLLLISTRCCKCWANSRVRAYKKSIQKEDAKRIQDYKQTTLARTQGAYPQAGYSPQQQGGYMTGYPQAGGYGNQGMLGLGQYNPQPGAGYNYGH